MDRETILENLSWQIRFGRSKKKISPESLYDKLKNIHTPPVFFLSTGRCGTKWFADFLKSSKTMAVHAPLPDFGIQGNFAYANNNPDNMDCSGYLEQIFLAGREQYLRYSYKTNKRYIETNNHLTFFCGIISELIPEAKFVHLTRSPWSFIESGLNRNWYLDQDSTKRQIVPNKRSIHSINWSELTREEKIGWLWLETNSFIEDFKETISASKFLHIRIEDRTTKELKNLLGFLEINQVDKRKLSKSFLTKRRNHSSRHQKATLPKSDNFKSTYLLEQITHLCIKYNYEWPLATKKY